LPSQRHLCRIFACAILAASFGQAHSHSPMQPPAVSPQAPAFFETTSWFDRIWKLPLFQFFIPDYGNISELQGLSAPEFSSPPCSVDPLPDIEDAEALGFEENASGLSVVSLDGLTPSTARALARFERIVTSAGGSLAVTSAYRPVAYQDHLQAVWDKWMIELRNNSEPGCQLLRSSVEEEFTRHQLLASQRPASSSDHTLGISFDANVLLPMRGRRARRFSIDRLARRAGMHRPAIRRDPVHFRIIGPIRASL
jgi:hypothetical protein